MILDWILTLPLVLVQTLVGFLPDYAGLPAGALSAITHVTGQMAGVASLFPMSTVKTVVTLIMSTEIAIFLFHAGAWVFHWRQR